MADTITALDLPYEEAIRFFRQKANVKTRNWRDVYAAAHSRMFMVAGAASEALLQDLRQAVDKAIADGTTLETFRKDFDEIVARTGWTGWTGDGTAAGRAWRTQIIYDTNLRTAYAAGRYAAMSAPETLEVFPYWQYHHSGSNHPRLEHLSWDGLVLRADDPFWQSNYPPNGWHCGCFVTPVSQAQLPRQGKTEPDQAPDLLWSARDVGGKKVQVPTGVDAGFEYNPGREWLTRTAPGNQTVAAAPGIIEWFANAAFREAVPKPAYVAASLMPAPVARAFNLPATTEMRISSATIHQHTHHMEATAPVYAQLIEYAMSEGAFYEDDKGRVSALVTWNDKLWQLGFKKTRHDEVYVTTVHYTREAKRRQLLKRGKLIWQKGE